MNDLSSNLQQGLWWTQTSSSPHGGGGGATSPTPWGAPHWLSERGDTKEEIQHATSQEMEQEHDQQGEEEMEHMFEKPLTPSDVGKLNRLVIPKQHAEKYFPLSRADSVEKGLLLSFEDESGKLWRFRYSYWNSSQSYVLTKGWSRFVKEKQLDAGDVVSFERRRPDGQQLYIRWRRRVAPPAQNCRPVSQNNNTTTTTSTSSPSSSSAWTRVYYSAHPYPSHHLHGPLLYQPDCLHAAAQPVAQNPVATGNKKRVRLFGVNLDCQLDEPEPEPPSPDTSSFSSQGGTHFIYSQGHHIQQGYNFSGEYNQTRNYPGGSGDMSI